MTPEQTHQAILDSPALQPPPGVMPNFADPPNLRNDPLSISLLLISTTVVWIRDYTKARVVGKLVLQDCAYRLPTHPYSLIVYLDLLVLAWVYINPLFAYRTRRLTRGAAIIRRAFPCYCLQASCHPKRRPPMGSQSQRLNLSAQGIYRPRSLKVCFSDYVTLCTRSFISARLFTVSLSLS